MNQLNFLYCFLFSENPESPVEGFGRGVLVGPGPFQDLLGETEIPQSAVCSFLRSISGNVTLRSLFSSKSNVTLSHVVIQKVLSIRYTSILVSYVTLLLLFKFRHSWLVLKCTWWCALFSKHALYRLDPVSTGIEDCLYTKIHDVTTWQNIACLVLD